MLQIHGHFTYSELLAMEIPEMHKCMEEVGQIHKEIADSYRDK